MFALVMLAVDIIYAFADPRVKARYAKAAAKKG
jgi:ABC-type dipeptide/oligopeptide/nickel transport system permease component